MPLTEFDDFQVLMGAGYNDPYNTSSLGNGLSGDKSYLAASYPTRTIQVYHPGLPGAPGIPGTPPTKLQIKRFLNQDWNTWARSINKLEDGSACRFSVPAGSMGVFVAIGGKGMEGVSIPQFAHALVSDLSGIHVLERGIKVKTMSVFQRTASLLRIQRQGRNVIYVLTTGTETNVDTSAIEYPSGRDAYIYAMLYSSGDTVASAEFMSSEVLYGRF